MGAGHFLQPMEKQIIYMLLMATAASVAAQTTTYTEEGGAVIVIDQTTGELVSESNHSQIAGGHCTR